MSLSVPQNGIKADNEPVIELFVKVRPQHKSHGRSFPRRVTLTHTWSDPHHRIVMMNAFFSALERDVMLAILCIYEIFFWLAKTT